MTPTDRATRNVNQRNRNRLKSEIVRMLHGNKGTRPEDERIKHEVEI